MLQWNHIYCLLVYILCFPLVYRMCIGFSIVYSKIKDKQAIYTHYIFFSFSATDESYAQPCNGASKDALSKMALPYEEHVLNVKDKILTYEPDENMKYFIPTDTKKYTTEEKDKNGNLVTYDIQYEGL